MTILNEKMAEEKKLLEQRLAALGNSAPSVVKQHRRYPPVLPKYADPANPARVWSGRGRRPHWGTENLAKGVSLENLRVDAAASPTNRALSGE